MDALREFITGSGIEEDPYKVIILAERFILEYGTKWTQETVKFLKQDDITEDHKLEVILDIVQTQKTVNELLIFKYYKDARVKR